MKLYALIGYPLGHSFSKKYFSEKFEREGIADARYELFPLENIAELPDLLRQHPDLCGLNVTIPHKEQVMGFLDVLDETAAEAGAVNCIRIREGRLEGFNTDTYGFEWSLRGVEAGRWAKAGTAALILGTGGAAKAVGYVLKKLGIEHRFVTRNPMQPGHLSYEDLAAQGPEILEKTGLIVNTTPLGMAPRTDSCPNLPFGLLSDKHLVFDLVYNPAETLLLQRAALQGAAVKNGLEMLHLQAEKAWEIWSPMPAPNQLKHDF